MYHTKVVQAVLSRVVHECTHVTEHPIDPLHTLSECVKARFEKRKNAITSATLSRDSFLS